MSSKVVMDDMKKAMEQKFVALEGEIGKIRTGRASITILDGVRVDYYGTPSPLNQVATLSTPDARTILVSPFEKRLIQDIEKAILKADLGLQPNSDGNVVRVPIPALTEERRKDLVKQLKKTAEDGRVAIRLVRRDANDAVKKLEKDKKINEDESRKVQTDIQTETDKQIKRIDDRVAAKEKEIMTL